MNGDGAVNIADFNLYRPKIGTVLPAGWPRHRLVRLNASLVDLVLGAIDPGDFAEPSTSSRTSRDKHRAVARPRSNGRRSQGCTDDWPFASTREKFTSVGLAGLVFQTRQDGKPERLPYGSKGRMSTVPMARDGQCSSRPLG